MKVLLKGTSKPQCHGREIKLSFTKPIKALGQPDMISWTVIEEQGVKKIILEELK